MMRFFTSSVMKPADETELTRLIGEASQNRMPIEIRGSGSKQGIGRPSQAAAAIDMTGFAGITLYEPTELVMSALAGTPLALIEDRLAAQGQMLAFEPLDLGPLGGNAAQQGTIGGVFMTNMSGSRRVSAGAARDHLLGIQAVNGRGERFKSGGRVMKNVTGVDLCRGLAGSWGTLAVATEVTFKVLPKPQETRTLVFLGLHDDIAVEVMCAAMGTPFEISGACHLQLDMVRRLREPRLNSQDQSMTLLRLENFSSFLDARTAQLKSLFKAYGDIHELGDATSRAVWGELREVSFLIGPQKDAGSGVASLLPVWRISTAPMTGPKVVRALSAHMPCTAVYDWSGGLIWLEVPASADAGANDVRRVMATHGGHATLMRADMATRAAIDIFQPLSPSLQRLSRGLKAAFDPAGILNPGRMYVEA
jgi:glycolate oxidase FAD binding subunit